MTITINGVDYAFEMTGTVGLVYNTARKYFGREELDMTKTSETTALFHNILVTSNKGKDVPKLDEFECCLTTALYTQMRDYFAERWAELEGVPSEAQKGDMDGKNA
ncbi:MAG: hypothetical protein LUI09_05705 [Prevotellaceae bacterium]|nr:hypothetical protein [Prevotellaceae bacterium]